MLRHNASLNTHRLECGEEGIDGLNLQDLGSDWVLGHALQQHTI